MAIKEQIILQGVNKTHKAFNDAQKSLNRIESNTHKASNAFGKLQTIVVGAAAAIGAIKLSKDFLNTAVEVENLGIQLKFLTGSAEEGARAMDILTQFAGQVPFELQQIANAAPNLLTVVDSTDELQQMLQITGDIAAATGLDFKTTAEQIQRAFSGGIAAADIFREKGVKALLGFEEGVRYNADQTRQHIISAFEDGSAVMIGASGEMADTFTGTMSMLSDKLFQFQKKLMESGPFDFIKGLMKEADEALTRNFGSIEEAAESMGKKITEVARTVLIGGARMIDAVKPVFSFIGTSIGNLIEATNNLHPTIKAMGLVGFMLLGIKGKAVVLIIGSALKPIKSMFAEIFELQAKATQIARDYTPFLSDERKAIMTQNIKEMSDAAARLRGEMDETEDKFKEAEVNLDVPKFFDADADIREIGEYEAKVLAMLDNLDKKTAQSALNQYNDKIMLIAKEQKVALAKEQEKQELLRIEQEKADKLMLLKKKTFNEMVTEAEQKEAKKRLFIAQALNRQKLEFHRLEAEGVAKFEEKMRKKQMFIAEQMHKRKMEFHRLESEGVKKFNEQNISYLQAYTEGFKGQIGEQMSTLDQLREAGARAFTNMTDALTDFVMTGKFNFKDFANMVIRDLIRIAVQAAATFAIKKALAAFGGPVGGFLSMFLEDGGPATAGKPYIVGEAGPELFIPNSSGKVISNDDMVSTGTAGRPVQVNFTVNAIDSQSFTDTLQTQKDTIVGIINEAVIEQGRPAIA